MKAMALSIATAAAATIQVTLDEVPLHHVPDTFLSVNMDAGQFYKGHFWHDNVTFPFQSKALLTMAKQLAPAYFRVGGTEADTIWYDIRGCFEADRCGGEAQNFQEGLPVESIDSLYTFATEANFTVTFGLNGGRGPRDASGALQPKNAAELVQYVSKKYPAASGWWELGNEPEAFVLGQKQFISSKQLVDDFRQMKQALKEINSDQHLVGIDITGTTAYVPPTGLSLLPGFLKHGGGEAIDAITYHWYPLIGASAELPAWAFPLVQAFPLEATAKRIVGQAFDSTEVKMREMQKLAKQYNKSLFLGETSSAAIGGLDGGSNRFASSLFYLFLLGQAAATGHDAVMRQSLIGASYALIDKVTMTPLPDYWAAVLHKSLMGSQVHAARAANAGKLRVFSHCHRSKPGYLSLLIINPTSDDEAVDVREAAGKSVEAMVLTAADDHAPLTAAAVRINGQKMETGDVLPDLPEPIVYSKFGQFKAHAYSAAFLAFEYAPCGSEPVLV